MPVFTRTSRKDLLPEHHRPNMMQRNVAVLLREIFISRIWIWIAFNTKAGAIDGIILLGLPQNIIQFNRLWRNRGLSDHSTHPSRISTEYLRFRVEKHILSSMVLTNLPVNITAPKHQFSNSGYVWWLFGNFAEYSRNQNPLRTPVLSEFSMTSTRTERWVEPYHILLLLDKSFKLSLPLKQL